jgi:hypothetical protein
MRLLCGAKRTITRYTGRSRIDACADDASQETAPTCSSDLHAAGDMATCAKSAEGAIPSQTFAGVGSIKHARHALVERVGDLQNLER